MTLHLACDTYTTKVSFMGTLKAYERYICSNQKTEIDAQCSQANILIDDSGKACVADFGLSKIKYDATSQSVTTRGGYATGTTLLA